MVKPSISAARIGGVSPQRIPGVLLCRITEATEFYEVLNHVPCMAPGGWTRAAAPATTVLRTMYTVIVNL